MAITKAALARSIDVLALTTKEQTYRCWDTEWPSKSEDIPRVRHPAGLPRGYNVPWIMAYMNARVFSFPYFLVDIGGSCDHFPLPKEQQNQWE